MLRNCRPSVAPRKIPSNWKAATDRAGIAAAQGKYSPAAIRTSSMPVSSATIPAPATA